VPTNPKVRIKPGNWTVNLFTPGDSFEATITSIIKTGPAVDKKLTLNFFFVGTEGLTAETAKTDSNFKSMIDAVAAVYQQTGITLEPGNYVDITGADAATYGLLDPDTEMSGLFKLAPQSSAQAVNLFFVADIAAASSGFSLLGQAGGVPGPAVLQGTSRSGVAINMASYLAAVAADDSATLSDAAAELTIIVAHETGHFLGLYHTVERNGADSVAGKQDAITGQDPLADTPVCAASADTDGDGKFELSECADSGADNLMFWSPSNDSRTLSADQASVLMRNPVVR